MCDPLAEHALISGLTAVCAIIADPVAGARTPFLMNKELRRRGLDAALVPLRVRADGLRTAVTGIRSIENFAGAVVSMPHKQAIVPLLDSLTATARAVGAVNVLRRDPDGLLVGEMLDGRAFLAGLETLGVTAARQRVLLVGAGGAATAIAYALAFADARSIAIMNRTRSRAEDLAGHIVALGCDASVSDGCGHFDIVINASSVGMDGGDEAAVLPAVLRPGMVVSDIIVTRAETHLMTLARDRGCTVQNGEAMLRAQIPLMADYMLASAVGA